MLDDVERTLRTEFMSNLARTNRRDAHEMMAEIFNNLDRKHREPVPRPPWKSATASRPNASRALMFTFEDLSKLDPDGGPDLLRSAEKDKVPIALKGASDGLTRPVLLATCPNAPAKIMREEMDAMGPVRLREVDEAQTSMVQMAKDLAAKGQIEIGEGKDEELVYSRARVSDPPARAAARLARPRPC